jgi:hypothetical protein
VLSTFNTTRTIVSIGRRKVDKEELGLWLIAGTFSYLMIAYAMLRLWTPVPNPALSSPNLQQMFYLNFWWLEYPIVVLMLIQMVVGIAFAFEEEVGW